MNSAGLTANADQSDKGSTAGMGAEVFRLAGGGENYYQELAPFSTSGMVRSSILRYIFRDRSRT
jgi:hypothetical protein